MDLVAQDAALRREADELLERTGLMRVLGEYGQPHISGSYSMQLMTWRDLDLYLEMRELDEKRFGEMGARLIALLQPRRASFIDHVHYPATEAVVGLYWGIRTGSWKIDIWGVTAETCATKLRECKAIAEALDEQMRLAVLAIKNDVCHDRRYRDTITSQHIYDAVIKHGVRTTALFWESLR